MLPAGRVCDVLCLIGTVGGILKVVSNSQKLITRRGGLTFANICPASIKDRSSYRR